MNITLNDRTEEMVRIYGNGLKKYMNMSKRMI
jgi:hypothetical protein